MSKIENIDDFELLEYFGHDRSELDTFDSDKLSKMHDKYIDDMIALEEEIGETKISKKVAEEADEKATEIEAYWKNIPIDKVSEAVEKGEVDFGHMTLEQVEALIKADQIDGWIYYYDSDADLEGYFSSELITRCMTEELYKEYLVSGEDNPPLSSKEWQRRILIHGGISESTAELFVSEWIEGNEYNEFINKLNKSE